MTRWSSENILRDIRCGRGSAPHCWPCQLHTSTYARGQGTRDRVSARAHPAVQTIPADPNWIRRPHRWVHTPTRASAFARTRRTTTIIPRSRLIADKIPPPRDWPPGPPRNFPRPLPRTCSRASARALQINLSTCATWRAKKSWS